jgi:hypothetical protein
MYDVVGAISHLEFIFFNPTLLFTVTFYTDLVLLQIKLIFSILSLTIACEVGTSSKKYCQYICWEMKEKDVRILIIQM